MTTRQLLKQEGLLEGMQKGRQERDKELKQIVSALKKGKSPDEIADAFNVSIELVHEWKDLLGL